MPTSVSVIGMGKLGAPMAAAMAARGIRAIGVDSDAAKVEAIERGMPPVFEPRLAETLNLAQGRLTSTQSIEDSVRDSDITFIVVATPAVTDGSFSLRYVLPVCEAIGRALAAKREYHVVALTSTVMPGSTDGDVRDTLEKISHKRAGKDFGLCYSPEFIALGSVIRDFLNPDFLLIGEFDASSGEHLAACYADIMGPAAPVRRMSLENAELAKISVNAFVTMKITFANMLAEMCAAVPGGDVDTVTDAIGLDSRIGRKYLTGGLGFGGPCFPRDNIALGFIAETLGARADLSMTTDRLNRANVERIVHDLAGMLSRDRTVAVLGLAYKPFSHVIEDSQAMQLVKALLNRGVRV